MSYVLYLLINLAVLTLAGTLVDGRRRDVFLALWALGFGIGMFNGLIEAVVFGVMPLSQAAGVAAVALATFALLALVATGLSGLWSAAPSPPVAPNVGIASLAPVVLAYELLYFGAGALVFPYVADFYATRRLPALGLVAGLQVVRALLFVAWIYPLLRLGPRRQPLLVALIFSIVGGIAPLIPDNPLMPSNIRFYHAIEVTISNFLFGLIVGWLLRPRAGSATA